MSKKRAREREREKHEWVEKSVPMSLGASWTSLYCSPTSLPLAVVSPAARKTPPATPPWSDWFPYTKESHWPASTGLSFVHRLRGIVVEKTWLPKIVLAHLCKRILAILIDVSLMTKENQNESAFLQSQKEQIQVLGKKKNIPMRLQFYVAYLHFTVILSLSRFTDRIPAPAGG